MKRYAVVFWLAVALLAIQASGQTAARIDKAVVAPVRGAKLGVQIPQLIAYQGKLTDSTGRPVNDGKYVMVFSLYADFLGSSFWQETQTVETKGGLFNVLLGSSVPISIDAVPQGGCYLGMRVLPSAQEFHRQRIVSVPFAFQADNSAQVQGQNLGGLDTLYVNENETAGGDLSGTYPNPALAPSGVVAGTYGSATQVARFRVDAKGRVDSIGNVDLSPTGTNLADGKIWVGNASGQATPWKVAGDASLGDTGALTLGPSGVAPDTYGLANQVPRIAVDAKGRITHASNVTVSPVGASLGASHIWVGNNAPAVANSGRVESQGVAAKSKAGRFASAAVEASVYGDVTLSYTGGDSAAVIINNGAVTTTKIADTAVTMANIATNAVTSAKILDHTITSTDLDSSMVPGTYGDGYHVGRFTVDAAGRLTMAHDDTILGAAPTGHAGGALAGSYPNPTIAPDSVTSAKILNRTIAAVDIDTGAVTSLEILDGTVCTIDLAATGVATGTYGSATRVGRFQVDAKGRLLTADSVAISGVPPGGSATGDLSGSYPNPTVAQVNGGTVPASAGVLGTNSSKQLVSVSAVPIANGGTNTSNTLTGIVRGGSSYTASELSGDATTSGSNAVTVGRVNGGSVPASAVSLASNSSSQIIATPSQAANYFLAAPNGSAGSPLYRAIVAADVPNLSGDVTGGVGATSIAKLQGNTVSAGSPSSGQVLKWTGSAWAPRADSGTLTSVTQATGVVCTPNPITGAGTVGFDSTYGDTRYINESQAAGGDLTGTYPNPDLVDKGPGGGPYTCATISLDAKGRVTAASSPLIGGSYIPTGSSHVEVTATGITASPIILLTVGADDDNTTVAIKVSAVGTNKFTVKTINGSTAGHDVYFWYMVVKL